MREQFQQRLLSPSFTLMPQRWQLNLNAGLCKKKLLSIQVFVFATLTNRLAAMVHAEFAVTLRVMRAAN